VTSKATPSGINVTPTANSTGSTVPAVIIGCHAGSFCCLNFVSVQCQTNEAMHSPYKSEAYALISSCVINETVD